MVREKIHGVFCVCNINSILFNSKKKYIFFMKYFFIFFLILYVMY